MNKKLLLVYLLFFISINAMAAISSVDCKTAVNDITALNEQQLHCSKPGQTIENAAPQIDKVRDDNFTNMQFNNREQPVSGSITFILLIPALLVFVFSGFEKSNK